MPSDTQVGKALIDCVSKIHSSTKHFELDLPFPDPKLLEVAIRHHVTFSLHSFLSRILPSKSDPLFLATEQRVIEEAKHQIRIQQTLALIATIFNQSGIKFLLYKGLALESRFYEGFSRLSGDLDIIVTQESLNESSRLLEKEGAKRLHESSKICSTRCFALKGILIELHTSLVERHIARLPEPISLLNSCQEIQLRSGVRVATLNDTDHLLALLVHGFKHQWCRLLWILDIALALRRFGAEELENLFDLATHYRVKRIAYIGICLASEIFPTLKCFEPSILDRCIAQKYKARLFMTRTDALYKFENVALHMLAINGFESRARYLITRARVA